MSIDWGSLGVVAVVSAAFGLGIVLVFSVGLLGLSAAEGHLEGDRTSRLGRGPGFALAGVCGLICVAAVVYGIYLIAF